MVLCSDSTLSVCSPSTSHEVDSYHSLLYCHQSCATCSTHLRSTISNTNSAMNCLCSMASSLSQDCGLHRDITNHLLKANTQTNIKMHTHTNAIVNIFYTVRKKYLQWHFLYHLLHCWCRMRKYLCTRKTKGHYISHFRTIHFRRLF